MGMGVQGVFRHICVADVDIEIFILAGFSCRPWKFLRLVCFMPNKNMDKSSA